MSKYRVKKEAGRYAVLSSIVPSDVICLSMTVHVSHLPVSSESIAIRSYMVSVALL